MSIFFLSNFSGFSFESYNQEVSAIKILKKRDELIKYDLGKNFYIFNSSQWNDIKI